MTVIRPEPDFSTEATLREVRDAVAAQQPTNTSALAKDATLTSLLTELAQKLEPSDLAALATAAKQDTLLAELAQKLEPSDLAALATAAKQDALLGRFPAALDGPRLAARADTPTDIVASGTSPSNGTAAVTVDLTAQPFVARAVAMTFMAGPGTMSFQVSFDGGVSYLGFPLTRTDTATTNPATNTSSGGGTQVFAGSIPPGATHVRAMASLAGLTARVAVSPVPYSLLIANTVIVSGSVTPGVSNANIGYVRASGIGQDDSVAALGANATFTGTARDLTGASPGGAWAQSSNVVALGSAEVRGMAVSDVAGTLFLDVSRDNITYRRIKAFPMSNTNTDAVGAGTIWTADFEYKPKTRYARLFYQNGPTAQSHFLLQSTLMNA